MVHNDPILVKDTRDLLLKKKTKIINKTILMMYLKFMIRN